MQVIVVYFLYEDISHTVYNCVMTHCLSSSYRCHLDLYACDVADNYINKNNYPLSVTVQMIK